MKGGAHNLKNSQIHLKPLLLLLIDSVWYAFSNYLKIGSWSNIAKLSFNFNYNFVESWDGYVLNFPTTQPLTTHPEKYGITSASTAYFYYNFNYNF